MESCNQDCRYSYLKLAIKAIKYNLIGALWIRIVLYFNLSIFRVNCERNFLIILHKIPINVGMESKLLTNSLILRMFLVKKELFHLNICSKTVF